MNPFVYANSPTSELAVPLGRGLTMELFTASMHPQGQNENQPANLWVCPFCLAVPVAKIGESLPHGFNFPQRLSVKPMRFFNGFALAVMTSHWT